ncbi:hypothetical protein AUR04nite_34500 [Glutamicibacter uratoxydans]|uniref:Uncharacterized protein n=1 Tax=Glutamicibacter uratoxydans TaxID=43667 RepID=A0A4Y4DX15_GLUUR|nr:hypothetical protein [Glutamicibacter uratoxydans]GED07918.1 hypothetical protein AUR04nite_34500 [Glutamicibacter uratoxydans]
MRNFPDPRRKALILKIIGGLLAVVVVIAVVVLLLGQQGSRDAGQVAATETPVASAAPSVTGEDADALVLEAAEVLTTWTPAEDGSPRAAEQRASKYFTGELNKIMDRQGPGTPSAEWTEMASENAVSVPTVRLHDEIHEDENASSVKPPAGHEHDLERTVAAKWVWSGAGMDDKDPGLTCLLYFTLQETKDHGYLISSYIYRDVPTRYVE